MHQRQVLLLFVFCLVGSSFSLYRAAVVEYSPIYETGRVNRSQAFDIMNQNLENYKTYIQKASEQAADIILFPEDGLYGAYFYTRDAILPYLEYIPDVDPQNKVIPCDFTTAEQERSPILVKASCMARSSNITVVLNMGEIRYCSTSNDKLCPSDSRYQYNTLVAFSSSGELQAKYHKSHLYYEPQFDEPVVPDVVWFESDFGVKFGLLICFDMMFEEPQLSLYHKHNIRDFLWSSWWVDEPPLITGTQVELSRSLALPSNFLASGIGLSWYNSGSGIYSYGNPLQHWYNFGSQPLSKMMVADLPSPDEQLNIDKLLPLVHESLPNPPLTPIGPPTPPTITTFTATPGSSFQIHASSNNLTCYATGRVSEDSGSQLFGVYSLNGTYNGLFPAQICALLACADEACITPILDTVAFFDSFELLGNFETEKFFIMYPMVASNHSQIADPSLYSTNSQQFPTSLRSKVDHFDLLNAALFALEYHL